MSFDLINVPNSQNKHFSYIVDKNQIVSIGWNDSYRTHPIAKKYDYWSSVVHSELDSILKFQPHYRNLKNCTLVNVRVNTKGHIGISKPCSRCLKLISDYGFKEVYYTNFFGEFERLDK